MKWRSDFSFTPSASWEENAKLTLIAGVLPSVLRMFQVAFALSATFAIISRPTIWQFWVLSPILLISIYITARSINCLNDGDWRKSTLLTIIALIVATTGFNFLIKDANAILALIVLLITILGGIQYSAKAGYLIAIILIGIVMFFLALGYYDLIVDIDHKISQPARDIMKFVIASVLIAIGAKIIFLDHENMKMAISRITDQAAHLQQANEQLEEINQIKTKFMSDVSHELRTPITNLKLYLNLLTKVKPENHPVYVNKLKGQTDRLQHLIEKILQLTRLELLNKADKMTLVDLNQVISDAIKENEAQAREGGISLTFSQSDVPTIRGNKTYLGLAISNLIENSIEYTKDGSVQIITSYKPDTLYVQCQILDTGLGVSAEDLEHLFDRFYRGEAAKETSSEGLGIGLSIVSKVIELHHGQIHISNRENGDHGNGSHGMEVTFTLPIYTAVSPT